MCIFSMIVASVSNTKIFARQSLGNRQYLVYSMSYEADSELAMILPLPVPTDAGEDAVRYMDLSAYPTFFDDMHGPFMTRSFSATKSLPNLMVHSVGSFEASFVPQRSDFSRLDRRFRLDDNVWDNLPTYDDYGFAVFKLKAGAKSVHPMAFEFPRRNANQLFFPTVHVHHGQVEPKAEFHHVLYCQSATKHVGWQHSGMKAATFVDIDKSLGMVESELTIQMLSLQGIFANEDVVLDESH